MIRKFGDVFPDCDPGIPIASAFTKDGRTLGGVVVNLPVSQHIDPFGDESIELFRQQVIALQAVIAGLEEAIQSREARALEIARSCNAKGGDS